MEPPFDTPYLCTSMAAFETCSCAKGGFCVKRFLWVVVHKKVVSLFPYFGFFLLFLKARSIFMTMIKETVELCIKLPPFQIFYSKPMKVFLVYKNLYVKVANVFSWDGVLWAQKYLPLFLQSKP